MSRQLTDVEKLYDVFIQHPIISTDSRRIEPGAIFFALSGDNFDGNLYAGSALDKGASYVVVDNPEVVACDDFRYILVYNVLEILQQLAAFHRQKLGIPVLAISGSNGKTTTKELLGVVLAQKYRVQITQGNLNNHIGVPLTLLKLDSSCELAIVEMGASHCGEIALLASIAQPNYGLLTNVGKAHLEGFGGEQGVIKGKGELFDYLQSNSGLAFYRAEDKVISAMVNDRPSLETVAYSSEIDLPQSNLVGDYNRYNVAAAVSVGSFFSVPKDKIWEAVRSYMPTNNRSQRTKGERNMMIVDCYNANPSSVAVALENLRTECLQAEYLSKVAILGDMLELGDDALVEHRNVLTLLEQTGVDEVFLVGELFSDVASDYAPKNYKLHTYCSSAELIERFRSQRLDSRLVLLKGSRALGLEKLIEYL